MSYNTGGWVPGTYTPFTPYQVPTYQTPQTLPRFEVTRVHGRAGMDALQMAPNSQGLFLDETQAVIWFAQTDGAGYKTVTGYTIAPLEEAEKKDEKALEARVARLEELADVFKSHLGANGSGVADANTASGG